MKTIDARPVRPGVLFAELFERRVRKNGELLVRRRIGEKRAARAAARVCDAQRLLYGLFGDLEIQVVGEQHVELDAEQAALRQHAAALLDVVAEIGLERRVHDDDGLAEQCADLCAADVKHVGERAQVAERNVVFRRRQPVAEARAVDEEVQPAARAGLVQCGQLRLRIQAAVFGRLGDVDHLRLHHMFK